MLAMLTRHYASGNGATASVYSIMITSHTETGYREVAAGVVMKYVVHGANTMMVKFRLAAGSNLPPHRHPHEQTGFLVSGSLQFTIGGETSTLAPGASWCILGGVEHSVEALEDSEVLEVFAPIREDYLPAT